MAQYEVWIRNTNGEEIMLREEGTTPRAAAERVLRKPSYITGWNVFSVQIADSDEC